MNKLPYQNNAIHVHHSTLVDRDVPIDVRTVIDKWDDNTLKNTLAGNIYPGIIVYDVTSHNLHKCVGVPDILIDDHGIKRERTFYDCEWEVIGTDAVSENTNAYTDVGFIKQNTIIPQGTTLDELVDMMFNPELDVTPVVPQLILSNTGNNAGTYEIGSTISVNLNATYIDGYFHAADPDYPDIVWGEDVAADCRPAEVARYYMNNNIISKNYQFIAINGSMIFNAKQYYYGSTTIPRTNKGNRSSKSISNGESVSNNIQFNGKYKYFVGVNDSLENIRDLQSGWISNDVNITNEFEVESNKYMIIAVPAGYKLSHIDSGFAGVDVTNVFLNSKYTTYQISLDGSIYNVYYQKPIAEITKYLNIKITNG